MCWILLQHSGHFAWHYCALYNVFCLGIRQWRSRTDRVPGIFKNSTITANVPNIFYFWSNLRYFLLLHCNISHQAGYFLWCIGLMSRSAKNLDIQASPRATESLNTREEHFPNHVHSCNQISSAFTQPSSRDCNVCIHAVAYDLSNIHATSFKPLHPLRCTWPALRHTHAAVALHLCHSTRKTLWERSRGTHKMK